MSNKKNSFIQHAFILAIAGLLVRLIGFLYRLPLTNLIGDQGNAIYSYGYYLYMLFLIMSSAGLPVAISKLVSERIALKQYKSAHQVFCVAMALAAFSGLIGSLILFFGAKSMAESLGSPESYHAILTLSPTVFLVAIMAVFRGYFQGMNNSVPTAISQIIEQIFNAVFSVYLAYIFLSQGIPFAAAGGTAGTGIGAFAGLLFLIAIYYILKPRISRLIRSDKTKNSEPELQTAIKILKIAFPIIAGTAIFSITNLIDMYMVNDRLLQSAAFSAVAIDELYGQLTGKYVVLTTLPVSISTAMAIAIIPTISATLAIGDIREVNNKISIAIKLTMMLAIPASFGIGVLADQILLLLFPYYPAGGDLLRAGAISIIFLSLYQIVTGILQGSGYVYVPVVAAFFGATLKIPINHFLIAMPNINIIGAIISTTVCYMVASSICLGFLTFKMKAPINIRSAFFKPLFSSIFMAFGCYVSYYCFWYIYPNNSLATLTAIIISIIVYICFMSNIGGITPAEIRMMPFGKKIYSKLDSAGLINRES